MTPDDRVRGGRRPKDERAEDEVLRALDSLVEALAEFLGQVGLVALRSNRIHRDRAAGHSYAEIMTDPGGPLVSELVSSMLASLLDAGSRFRQAEAQALYDEGLTMSKIAALFGVSRQRVSTLLRDARRYDARR
jgi:DNA-directed RNA polymerase specialized sigma24 family protein